MEKTVLKSLLLVLVLSVFLLAVMSGAEATINGITGTSFTLTATTGYIQTSDGATMFMWGYANGSSLMQYPGPTLIVNQGATITVTLNNALTVPVSIVFPGQVVATTGGTPGLLTQEAPPGGTVTYTFTATQPGTYMYYSGTQSELQVEMGLFGALIVRSATPNQAYNDPATTYQREYLFVLSDADLDLHTLVELGKITQVDNTKRHPTAWFENGRNFPDTMSDAFVAWLPNQPYNAMPLMHPGERVLIRMVGAGRNLHPFHTHGQNHLVIARDGRLLSDPANVTPTPDLAESDYTTTSVAGETVDAIWGPWTGYKLGWDVYGDPAGNPALGTPPHTCSNPTGFDPVTFEWCPDHGKPIPVALPDPAGPILSFGPMYGGTPYLGISGPLPPLDPNGTQHTQLNPLAGISFMWHSHSERELTTNNIFIGGMATMALVLPPGIPIP